jgi:hypothetical protein
MQRLTAGITDTRAMLAIIMRLTSRAPVHAFVRRLGIFASSLFFSFPSLFPEFWLFTTYLLICPIRCYILPEPTFSFLLYY